MYSIYWFNPIVFLSGGLKCVFFFWVAWLGGGADNRGAGGSVKFTDGSDDESAVKITWQADDYSLVWLEKNDGLKMTDGCQGRRWMTNDRQAKYWKLPTCVSTRFKFEARLVFFDTSIKKHLNKITFTRRKDRIWFYGNKRDMISHFAFYFNVPFMHHNNPKVHWKKNPLVSLHFRNSDMSVGCACFKCNIHI